MEVYHDQNSPNHRVYRAGPLRHGAFHAGRGPDIASFHEAVWSGWALFAFLGTGFTYTISISVLVDAILTGIYGIHTNRSRCRTAVLSVLEVREG